MPGGEQQQMLIRERPHEPVFVHAPQHRFQGIVPFLHFQLRHVSPAYRPEPSSRHDQLPYCPSVGQQTVQVSGQKAFDAHLPPAAGHVRQEIVEPFLRLRASALHLKAAAQPHHFPHGGIQHRDGLPHFPVDPFLPAAQGHKPPHSAEGMGIPAAQLTCHRAASGLLFPFQFIVSFPRSGPRRPGQMSPAPSRRSSACRPWRDRAPCAPCPSRRRVPRGIPPVPGCSPGRYRR